MDVILASCGNPDYFQDPRKPMHDCESNCYCPVDSLQDAAIKCREFIARNNLGTGNWAGGKVYEGNKCIAIITYNGKTIILST